MTSDDRTNEIIAKYMFKNGGYFCGNCENDGGECDRCTEYGPVYTESLDKLFTVIHKIKRETFNISTEVYGLVNGWAHRGDYSILPLARDIEEVIVKWLAP